MDKSKLTQAQQTWLDNYCRLSKEGQEYILSKYNVVSCACNDPCCKGWRLELKPTCSICGKVNHKPWDHAGWSPDDEGRG